MLYHRKLRFYVAIATLIINGKPPPRQSTAPPPTWQRRRWRKRINLLKFAQKTSCITAIYMSCNRCGYSSIHPQVLLLSRIVVMKISNFFEAKKKSPPPPRRHDQRGWPSVTLKDDISLLPLQQITLLCGNNIFTVYIVVKNSSKKNFVSTKKILLFFLNLHSHQLHYNTIHTTIAQSFHTNHNNPEKLLYNVFWRMFFPKKNFAEFSLTPLKVPQQHQRSIILYGDGNHIIHNPPSQTHNTPHKLGGLWVGIREFFPNPPLKTEQMSISLTTPTFFFNNNNNNTNSLLFSSSFRLLALLLTLRNCSPPRQSSAQLKSCSSSLFSHVSSIRTMITGVVTFLPPQKQWSSGVSLVSSLPSSGSSVICFNVLALHKSRLSTCWKQQLMLHS